MAGTRGANVTTAGINTANSAYFGLRPVSTAVPLSVVEIGVGIAFAPTTAPAWALVRTTANGTASTLVGQAFNIFDTRTVIGTADFTYTVQPTFVTANQIIGGDMAITAGGFIIWTFYDDPIVIDAVTTHGLAIMNINASGATTGTFQAYWKWTE